MQCVLVFLLAMSAIAPIEGHGRLKVPPARTTMWREGFPTIKNYNDAELNCGGFAFQWYEQGGKCGVCGDPWRGPRRNEVASGKYDTGIITRNYIQGELIDVTVEITANHRGYHIFHLCPNKHLTEECFQKYVLADEKGQTKIPINAGDSTIKLKLQLPPGLTCKIGVLRWKWVCGNRWGCENNGTCCKGCGKKQEHFYGCSDIAIQPKKGAQPTTTAAAATTTTTTTTQKPVIKSTPMSVPTLPPKDNPWIQCPLTMKCAPVGPYLPGSAGTMCTMQCGYQVCPVVSCHCSCPEQNDQ